MASLRSLLDTPQQQNDQWPELTRQYITARDNVASGCSVPLDVDLTEVRIFLESHCQIHSLDNDFATSEKAVAYLERLAGYNGDMTPVGRIKTCEHCSRPLRKPDVDRYESTRGNDSWCDFIVAGGYGTTGALQATRLSKAYPDKEICIVDIGERVYNSTEWQQCPQCVVGPNNPFHPEGISLLAPLCDLNPATPEYAGSAFGAFSACYDRATAGKTGVATFVGDHGLWQVYEGKTSSNAALDEMPISQPRGVGQGGSSQINGQISLRPTIHLLEQYAELLGEEFSADEMLRVAKLLENRNQRNHNGFRHFADASGGLSDTNGFDPRWHSRHEGELNLFVSPMADGIFTAYEEALKRAFGGRFNNSNLRQHPDVDAGREESYVSAPLGYSDAGEFVRCWERANLESIGLPPSFFRDECTPQEWLEATRFFVRPRLPRLGGSIYMQPPYEELEQYNVKDMTSLFATFDLMNICFGTHAADPSVLLKCTNMTFVTNELLGQYLPLWTFLNPFSANSQRNDAFDAFLGRHVFFPNGTVRDTTPCEGWAHCFRVDGTNVRVFEQAFITRLVFEDEIAGGPNDRRRVMGVRFFEEGRNVNRVGRTRRPNDLLVPFEEIDANVRAAEAAGERMLLARVETVVALSAFDTPALFQRSGVARVEDLDAIDEPVDRRLHLSGVGHHLHNHADMRIWSDVNFNEAVPRLGLAYAPEFHYARIKSSPTKEYPNMHAGLGVPLWGVSENPGRTFLASGALENLDTKGIPNFNKDEWPSLKLDKTRPLGQGSSVFFEQQQSESTGSVLIWTMDPTQPPVIDSSIVKNERDMEDLIDAMTTFAIPYFENGLAYVYGELAPNAYNGPVALSFVSDFVTGKALVSVTNATDPSDFRLFADYVQPERREMFTAIGVPGVTYLGTDFEACNASCADATEFVSTTETFASGNTERVRTNVSAESCTEEYTAFRTYDEATRILSLSFTRACAVTTCTETAACVEFVCDVYGEAECVSETRRELVETQERLDRQKLRIALNKYKHSGYHESGTMKMGPEEDLEAVTDACGRVYGLKGVSVADVSVLPISPDVNTMMPAYMFAERTWEKRCKDNNEYLGLENAEGACRRCPVDDVTCKECPGAIPEYSVPGPYHVGHLQLEVLNWNNTLVTLNVWYPASGRGATRPTYDVVYVGSTPPNAWSDAPIAEDDAPFQLYISMHPLSAKPAYYVRNLEHLASHGIVAASMAHSSYGFGANVSDILTPSGFVTSITNAAVDIQIEHAFLAAASAGSVPSAEILQGKIDSANYVIGGLSFGTEPIRRAVAQFEMPMPKGVVLSAGPEVPAPYPPIPMDVPSLHIVGALDMTAANTPEGLGYNASTSAKTLVYLHRSGHNTVLGGEICATNSPIQIAKITAPVFGGLTGPQLLDLEVLPGQTGREVLSDGCPNSGDPVKDAQYDDPEQVRRVTAHAITAFVRAARDSPAQLPGTQLTPQTSCYFEDFVSVAIEQQLV
jgi:choline dehydrogenase-like flavoprotein